MIFYGKFNVVVGAIVKSALLRFSDHGDRFSTSY